MSGKREKGAILGRSSLSSRRIGGVHATVGDLGARFPVQCQNIRLEEKPFVFSSTLAAKFSLTVAFRSLSK